MINKQFAQHIAKQPKRNLTLYFTAGYPRLESTKEVLEALNTSKASIIEIGMPYSDPLADGEVIQKTASQALQNGMNVKLLFEQLKETEINKPVFLMGYFNPFLQFGAERFLKKCKEVGVSGLILPDLPLDVYKTQYKAFFEENDQKICFLITPESSEKRIRELAKATTGFLYLVTSNATTGGAANLDHRLGEIIQQVKRDFPERIVQLGFGIRDKEGFNKATALADGAIVGSAFLKALEPNDLKKSVTQFVKKILD